VYDGEDLFYYSNKEGVPKKLTPGRIYGVSNELLDSPWPKLLLGKKKLESIIEEHVNTVRPFFFCSFFLRFVLVCFNFNDNNLDL